MQLYRNFRGRVFGNIYLRIIKNETIMKKVTLILWTLMLAPTLMFTASTFADTINLSLDNPVQSGASGSTFDLYCHRIGPRYQWRNGIPERRQFQC